MSLARFLISTLVVCLSLIFSSQAIAQIKLAVVGKTKNDSFYEQSYAGCLAFAEKIDELTCVYDGADDYQDVRTQVLIVKDLLSRDIDGIMVSTTDSQFLSSGALAIAKDKNIPVVTIDSDLLPEHQAFRLAYVGTNNFDFGVALGKAAQAYKQQNPQPVCIQTGHQTTPNLNKRIDGVRFALSQGETKRLDGSSGWIEHPRCPLFTMGRREDALTQLEAIADYSKPPVFIAVAGFAQFHPKYVERMAPYKSKLASHDLIVISADTEEVQLKALSHGFSTINIGQNPFEMGRKSAELLYQYIKAGEQPSQDKYYLPFHYCTRDNSQNCTTKR
ncbi:substrate-binding domain-containing protein [Pseudoalteromonas sp. T1lg65]|uniref:substrate-binding domain-containing protein n=1 Tax=Pseudoalteromonas sp. T1lg65 TaxID=2077101 RepID=UPI003F7A9D95